MIDAFAKEHLHDHLRWVREALVGAIGVNARAQGRDNIGVMLAIGPDHRTRAIGRFRRFTLHS